MFIMRCKESSRPSRPSYTITDESPDNNEISHESAGSHRWYSKKSVGPSDIKLNFAKKRSLFPKDADFQGLKDQLY
jgi:hypothetical protein